MNTQKAKAVAGIVREPLETLKDELFQPTYEEIKHQITGFMPEMFSAKNSKEIAKADLAKARQDKALKEKDEIDRAESEEKIIRIREALHIIQKTYARNESIENKKSQDTNVQIEELKAEISKLSKAAGVATKAHLENTGTKAGEIDIKRLTAVAKTLRQKAEKAKDNNDIQSQGSAKRTSGMMAWVSGKQMKIHEQGTLTLQG